jgi:hypothetical protein
LPSATSRVLSAPLCGAGEPRGGGHYPAGRLTAEAHSRTGESRKPPTSPASPSTPGPSLGPMPACVTPEPIASHQRVLACTGPAGDPRTGAAKRGQAADISELPLRILMQSPAPAFAISHAVRHMTERCYPSSGRARSMLNRKSVRSWACGSTRRSAAEPGSFAVVWFSRWERLPRGGSGRLLEGDFHPGQAFQFGDELAFAP